MNYLGSRPSVQGPAAANVHIIGPVSLPPSLGTRIGWDGLKQLWRLWLVLGGSIRCQIPYPRSDLSLRIPIRGSGSDGQYGISLGVGRRLGVCEKIAMLVLLEVL